MPRRALCIALETEPPFKASGKTEVYEPTKAEREEWREALVASYKNVEGRVGKDIIRDLQAAVLSQ